MMFWSLLTYLQVRIYITNVRNVKAMEIITPTRDIVFNDCLSSETFEYGLIKIAKFVRWLHWQTVLLESLSFMLHPLSVHLLIVKSQETHTAYILLDSIILKCLNVKFRGGINTSSPVCVVRDNTGELTTTFSKVVSSCSSVFFTPAV